MAGAYRAPPGARGLKQVKVWFVYQPWPEIAPLRGRVD